MSGGGAGGEGAEGAGATEAEAPAPSVSWAQSGGLVFLTFNVECARPEVKISREAVEFRGACGPERRALAVRIPLYAPVAPDRCSTDNKGRVVEVVLAKERADEPWWPALTSDARKRHWLKVDFERWRDEDESDDERPDDPSHMFSDRLGDFGGDEADDDSSSPDEEDLPDLE